MPRNRLSVLLLPVMAFGFMPPAGSAAVADIALSAYCPPGFALEKGVCRMHNQYTGKASLQNAGVGGPRSGLPAYRDGFRPQVIDLGRYLFFDPLLSKNGTLACASCHQPDKGFSDGLPRSVGSNGREMQRNAPSLWNTGLQHRLFWDGRAASFEQQMLGPLYDSKEMANTPENLRNSLNANPGYRRLFAVAFPDAGREIRLEQVYTALAAFQSSLISLNSRYDLYADGFHDALSADEIQGMNVFRSFVARCAECHTPPLFSNQQIAVIGMPQPEGRGFDAGAQAISGETTQRGGFKVPSLRNVAKTAPYSHSGRFGNLHETVEFYTLGRGHAVPKDQKLTLHWHIWEPRLSPDEINRLVDFLGALTDESFKPAVPRRVPSGLKPMPLPGRGNSTNPLTKETP